MIGGALLAANNNAGVLVALTNLYVAFNGIMNSEPGLPFEDVWSTPTVERYLGAAAAINDEIELVKEMLLGS